MNDRKRRAVRWVAAMNALYGIDVWHPDDPIEDYQELEAWRLESIEAFESEEEMYRVIEVLGKAQECLLEKSFAQFGA